MTKRMILFMTLTALFTLIFLSSCLSNKNNQSNNNSSDSSSSNSSLMDGTLSDSSSTDSNSSDSTPSDNNSSQISSSDGSSSNNSSSDASSSDSSSSDSSSTDSLSLIDNIETILTPPGANVTMNVDGALTMESNQSVSELKSFYKEALKSLAATEVSVRETPGTWDYLGTYDNGKNILISITNMADKGIITVIY